MPSIRLVNFAGIRPAVGPTNLPAQYAQRAHNAMLRDLTLKAWKQPELIRAEQFDIATIYQSPDGGKCCGRIHTWPHCASVIEYQTPGWGYDYDQLLLFWRADRPTEPQRYFRCTDAYHPIKVPAPTQELRAVRVFTAGTIEGKLEGSGPDQRAYTYTWVDVFGVESRPAPPSRTYRSYDDEHWRVEGFSPSPPNAVCVRIYRASSAFEDGIKVANPMDTTFNLVEEVPLDSTWTGVYIDRRRLLELEGGALHTYENHDIPEAMEQVVATEQGYLVGFRGNELFICERHEPHNWPVKYRQMLPDKIVALAAFMDVVYVATSGNPYKMMVRFRPAGDTADADIDVVPYAENYPCIGRQTMTPTDMGAAYCTHKGVVRLAPQGNAKLESRFRVDEDDFQHVHPNICVYQNGKYFGSRSPMGDGLIVDFVDRVEGDMDVGDLTTADLKWDAVHAGKDGFIYFSRGRELWRWNSADAPMTYEWRSKVFRMPGHTAFSAAKVVADYGGPVVFSLYRSGGLYYSREVYNSEPFRIPARGRGLEWEIELKGSSRIREVHVATSMTELVEEKGQS